MKRNTILFIIFIILLASLMFVFWSIYKTEETNKVQNNTEENIMSTEELDGVEGEQLKEIDAAREEQEGENGGAQEISEDVLEKQLNDIDDLRFNSKIETENNAEAEMGTGGEEATSQLNDLDNLRNLQ